MKAPSLWIPFRSPELRWGEILDADVRCANWRNIFDFVEALGKSYLPSTGSRAVAVFSTTAGRSLLTAELHRLFFGTVEEQRGVRDKPQNGESR